MSKAVTSRRSRDVRQRYGSVLVVESNNLPNNSDTKSKHSSNRSPRRSQDACKFGSKCRKRLGLLLFLFGVAVWFILFQKSYFVGWFKSNSTVPIPDHYSATNRSQSILPAETTETSRKSNKKSWQPRVFYIQTSWAIKDWLNTRGKQLLYPNVERTNGVMNAWNGYHDTLDRHCQPKASWQTKSYPNCNTVHEVEFALAVAKEVIDHDHVNSSFYSSEDDLILLGEGWFRTTWRLNRNVPFVPAKHKHHSEEDRESLVLKTLRIEREFLSEYFELHRRDAVAMERLTASNFVVDVFGFCGQSAINELANFHIPGVQNLEAFNRRLRGMYSYKTSVIKLRLAVSVALGLADIHAAGERRPVVENKHDNDRHDAYMVHYDLNPRNIALFAGGKPKINDFNIAEFLRFDPRTNITCGFPSRLHEPWWRAPEEMNMNATELGILVDEKVDVYALGNVLFHILTSHAPWGKMKSEKIPEIRPKVAKGIRAPIPKQFLHDKDPHIKALLKAIELCWISDPKKRATADDVASVLFHSLMDVKDEKVLDRDKFG
jgi:serine/threonine protein kinase